MANWWDDLSDSSQSGTATVEPPAAAPPAPSGNWWDGLSDSSQQASDTQQPTEAAPAPSPVEQSPNDYYAGLLKQNEDLKNNLRAQGVSEQGLDSAIYQHTLQKGAEDAAANAQEKPFGSFEQSFPVRVAQGAVQGVGETIGGTLLTGIGEATGSNAFRDAAQHVYDVGRSREAINSYENAGSKLKSAIQGGVDIIAQAAPAAGLGLGGLATYFGGTTAARTLSDARERGESTAEAYKQAATHGTIDAVWTMLGGELGSGIAKLAGADSGGVISKAVGKLTEDIKLPSWAKVAGSVAEGTAGQVAQGVGMGASHYLGSVALGERQFDKDEFIQSMESTIAPSLIAGAGGAAIHGFIGKVADTINDRVEQLSQVVEQAVKEQPAAEQPEQSPHEQQLSDKLDQLLPENSVPDQQPTAEQPTPEPVTQPTAQEQPPTQPDAAVSQAPDETPPQQPASVESSPSPPAASNTTGDLSQGEVGDTSFDFGANVPEERKPLLPREQHYVKRRIQRLEDSGTLPDDHLDTLKSLDPHMAHGILTAADNAAKDDGEVQSSLAGELKNLFAGDDRNVISYVNKAGKRITRKASSLGDLSLLARKVERRGGDPSEIPRFDQAVQALRETTEGGQGDFPHLAAEASARGNGDIEAGLFDILQGGAKQFAEGSNADYVKEILDQYNAVQERAKPAVEEVDRTADEGSTAQESAPESQPALPQGGQGQVAPFALSREGSPDTSPISEPFAVPESQRLPAQSPSERQPVLAGMSEDMNKGTLPGQQGLFNQNEQAGQVLGFGGGSKFAPLVANTKQQLSALVRTHTPGLDIIGGARKAKEGIASLLLPTANGPEYLKAAEGLGAELGAMNRRSESSAVKLKPYDKMFTRLGLDREGIDPEHNPGTQFRAAMSTGREVTGKFRKAADAISKLFSDRVQKLAEVGAPLQQVRDNYFPGMWTTESHKAFNAAIGEAIEAKVLPENFDPNNVTDTQKKWVKDRVDQHLENGTGSDKDGLQYLTRRPMAGKESFRKEKVFDDTLTAEQFGLRPISSNPIDLVKLKLAELDKSIMAHGYFQKLKAEGNLQQIDPYKQVPDGWVKINDKYGTVYGPPTVEVSEHLDKAVYDGLLDVAGKLGISHERLMNLPRKNALGLSYQGANKIQSKFGTETSVIAHEIGHQLDYRYNLWDNILRRDSGKGFQPGRSELGDIADLTERGRKARSKEEKVAQVLEAYVHAPEKMKEVAPRVFDWFDKFIKSKTELAPLADIKPGLALKKLTSEKYVGLPIVGYRIVPKAEGAIINNYLSSSLYNNPYFGGMYKKWMGTANALNQTQLGVGSAFHAGFTTGEAQIASNANVLKDMYGVVRGNRSLDDLRSTLGKTIIATGRTAVVGDRVLNAWRNPDGAIDPKVAQIVKAVELAGGGFKLETGLQTDQANKMARDWYSGKRLTAVARSPVAAIELMAKPIMEQLVPRQKAGIFADLAGRIIEQNPGKNLEDLTPEFRQAWNRVDARLGQARYNRLFTNNTAKNVVQGLIRAPGWSGGTIAEIGGAFPDAAKFVKEWVETGKPPQELPDRVAYSLALVGSVAALNGALTYAFTGQKPTGLDYFAFRDGGKDDSGKETRLLLPTYIKDLLAYWRDPGQTLVNKTHPLISLVSELAHNRDYYGTQIRNPSDGAVKQTEDAAGYVAKSFVPFWLRGAQKVREQGGGLKEQALPYVGVMPAPKHVTETPAERTAREFIQQRTPGTRTQEDAAKAQERSQIKTALRRGDSQPLKDAVASGDVSRRNVSDMRKSVARPPLVNMVKPLSASEALAVWDKADDTERGVIKTPIVVKIRNALKSASPIDRRTLLTRARELGVLPPSKATAQP